jgi:hypothetical protein
MRMSEFRPWLFLGSLTLAGVGLLVLASALDLGEVLHEIVVSLGGALVIAGVLGCTVDLWLKHQLLRDAFQATFGYLLPAELRDELTWIYEQDLLCFQHDQFVVLAPTDDADVVIAKTRIRRDIRNVGRRKVEWTQTYAVDDWGHPGHSPHISSMRVTKAEQGEQPLTEFEQEWPHPMVLMARPTRPVELAPGEELTATAEAEEPKRVNDELVFVLSQATKNPTVTVESPDGIDYRVLFGNRQQQGLRRIGPDTFELPGTLLPGQMLTVRWWRQSDADRATG